LRGYMPKRISVMVIGPSFAHGGVFAALLGASGHDGPNALGAYRYGDFGGALEPENQHAPHMGALQLMVESLQGRWEREQSAARIAETIWERAQDDVRTLERPGGFDYSGGHTVFVVPAAHVAEVLGGACDDPAGHSGIDLLRRCFRPNSLVCSVALVDMAELLRCAQEGVLHVKPLVVDQRGLLPDDTIWLRADMIGSVATDHLRREGCTKKEDVA